MLIRFRTAVGRCNITDSVDGGACSTGRVVVELVFKLSDTKLINIVSDVGGTSLSSQFLQVGLEWCQSVFDLSMRQTITTFVSLFLLQVRFTADYLIIGIQSIFFSFMNQLKRN